MLLSLATLFSFQHEAAVSVKIDKARARRSVGILEVDRALENILISLGLPCRRLGSHYPEYFAQFD